MPLRHFIIVVVRHRQQQTDPQSSVSATRGIAKKQT
jgi:hypothetical protein